MHEFFKVSKFYLLPIVRFESSQTIHEEGFDVLYSLCVADTQLDSTKSCTLEANKPKKLQTISVFLKLDSIKCLFQSTLNAF